jgi:hypothetical protein
VSRREKVKWRGELAAGVAVGEELDGDDGEEAVELEKSRSVDALECREGEGVSEGRTRTHKDIDDENPDVAAAIGKGPAELLKVLVAARILAVCNRREGQRWARREKEREGETNIRKRPSHRDW